MAHSSLYPPPHTHFPRLGGGDVYSVNASVRSFGLLHIIDEDKVYVFPGIQTGAIQHSFNWSCSTPTALMGTEQFFFLKHDGFPYLWPTPRYKGCRIRTDNVTLYGTGLMAHGAALSESPSQHGASMTSMISPHMRVATISLIDNDPTRWAQSDKLMLDPSADQINECIRAWCRDALTSHASRYHEH